MNSNDPKIPESGPHRGLGMLDVPATCAVIGLITLHRRLRPCCAGAWQEIIRGALSVLDSRRLITS